MRRVEFLLAEVGLDVAVVGAGAEGEAGDFDAGLAEGDGVGCGGRGCVQGGGVDAGEGSGSEGGFEEVAAAKRAHGRSPFAAEGVCHCKDGSTGWQGWAGGLELGLRWWLRRDGEGEGTVSFASCWEDCGRGRVGRLKIKRKSSMKGKRT